MCRGVRVGCALQLVLRSTANVPRLHLCCRAQVGMAMGQEGAPGGSSLNRGAHGSAGMDPQAVLSLIREYLIAK